MTKKYNIQLSDLEAILDVLLAYDDDKIVNNDIDTLKTAITRLKNNFNVPDNLTFIEKIARDLSLYGDYKKHYSYVSEFVEQGLLIEEAYKPEYKPIVISHSENIELCRDFFSQHGTFFSNAFEEYCEDIHDRLMFFEPNKYSEGEVHFLETTGDAFVLIPNHPNLTKTSISMHEFEHVIDCFNNPLFYRNKIVREVGSLFMEMIGCDYLAKKFSLKNDNVHRRLNVHSIIKCAALYTADKMEILKLIKGYQNANEESIIKNLNKRFGMSKADIDFLLECHLASDFYYQISYLIAIELYTIYCIDKDKAIYILIDIIMNANDYNYRNILNKHNIVLNSSVKKYEDDMCLKLNLKKED